MTYYLLSFLSLLLISLILFISKYKNILFEETSNTPRKIHTVKTIRIGSVSFLPIVFVPLIHDMNQISGLVFFSLLFLFIGMIEDISSKLSNYLRLFLLMIIIFAFIFSQGLTIKDFDSELMNIVINSNIFFSYLFVALGFLMLINGFNFIDGTNGLLLGQSLLIFTAFQFFSFGKSELIYSLSSICIALTFVLFIFNFTTGKILSGDGGAYFLGFIIGAISIIASNENILSEFQIAILIFYPVAELLLTFFRRIINKKNPFSPDELHLHIILYKILTIKFKDFKFIIKHNLCNSLTSLIILIGIGILYFLLYYYFDSQYIIVLYFAINIIYLISYFLIYLYAKKILII